MKMKSIMIVTALAVSLAGCANAPTTSSQNTASGASTAAAMGYSGFLSDYSRLRPAEGMDGVTRFVDRSVNLAPFTKLMIDPVQIVLTADPEYRGLQPDDMKRMTDAFYGAFVDAVASGYQIVKAPGPDVLRVRLAITGVQPTKPSLNVTDFIPIKALFNLGREAAGAAPHVAEISGELEVLDPANRQVAAAVATRKSDQTLAQGESIRWSDLQPMVISWARNFRRGLDDARGIPAK